jgi:FKBP-type peptidyl-prolyl cis-trans isomerase FklB
MIRTGILVAALLAFAGPASAANSALSPEANAAFLADYAKKPGVYTRPSGLMYRIIHMGVGMRPQPVDTVSVYYKGTLINGTVFDEMEEQGFPAQFKVNGVISGWQEALETMRVGDHWELVIPSNLAYGTRGGGGVIPPNQTLIFDMELVGDRPPTKEEIEEEQEKEKQGQSQ